MEHRGQNYAHVALYVVYTVYFVDDAVDIWSGKFSSFAVPTLFRELLS